MPEVATYVIETSDLRFEIQDVAPIGSGSLRVTVGDSVTFAVKKRTAYVRDANGVEHWLLVIKSVSKSKS